MDRRRGGRVILWVIALVLIVVVLFTVVFPRVERWFEDPTIGAAAGSGPPVAQVAGQLGQ